MGEDKIDLNQIREDAQEKSLIFDTISDVEVYVNEKNWSAKKAEAFLQFFHDAKQKRESKFIEENVRRKKIKYLRANFSHRRENMQRSINHSTKFIDNKNRGLDYKFDAKKNYQIWSRWQEQIRIQEREHRRQELAEYKRRDNLAHWLFKGKSMSHSQLRTFRKEIDIDTTTHGYTRYNPTYPKAMRDFFNDHIFAVWVTEGSEGLTKLDPITGKRGLYMIDTYLRRGNLYGEFVKAGAGAEGWGYNPEGGGRAPMGLKGIGRRLVGSRLGKNNQSVSPAKLPRPDAKAAGKRFRKSPERGLTQSRRVISPAKLPRPDAKAAGKRFRRKPKLLRTKNKEPKLDVLVVGAETAGEFKYALGVTKKGGNVIVANPKVTDLARKYKKSGGTFFAGNIEKLPSSAKFNLIREDFPYPVKVFPLTKEFVKARLIRLKPGGTWVVITESPKFVKTLEAVGTVIKRRVIVKEIPRYHKATPHSLHPKRNTRFAVTISK